MTDKMLIDAAHPEETRVVVLKGNRIDEFDFESASKKPLRGNIYLAKVTRVEPSLQAAFVDFGNNRHGFLAFSEIHPDYYQIPSADRAALMAEAAAEAEDEDETEEAPKAAPQRPKRRSKNAHNGDSISAPVEHAASEEGETSSDQRDDADESSEPTDEHAKATTSEYLESGEDTDAEASPHKQVESGASEDVIEQVGGADVMEEAPQRRFKPRRNYKIQEVIRRRQIILVQVVKEERGNKGAALTTYLSLAGRYCVLMPNTARGGGISRKITSLADRRRLKDLVSDLEVPQGMGVILRTAGASRTKSEIARDYDYLSRLWENVRELTLKSEAPTLVYEEGSLIKRAIRDLYHKEMGDIYVSGEEGHREARDFMKMLMPSQTKLVQLHRDSQPLFQKHGVESQLDAMFSNIVGLKSGGYIVINQTEALVAIDVNSGRSTREHNIEDTALKTNLEAADEVARQLRLRDLAGLVVIDFIDMEEKRNNRAVERRITDALKNDRARIQLGRISHFGLLEMSRQRIRTGVLESSSTPCPHCAGTGSLRSTPSLALMVLRAIEEALMKGATYDLIVRTRLEIALYILNQKRDTLAMFEQRYGVSILIKPDESLLPPNHFALEKGELSTRTESRSVFSATPSPMLDADADADEEADVEESAEDTSEETEIRESNQRRRRRRGGRNRRDRDGRNRDENETSGDNEASSENADANEAEDGEENNRDGEERGEGRKNRRRRGGRNRNRRRRDGEAGEGSDENTSENIANDDNSAEIAAVEAAQLEPIILDLSSLNDEAPVAKRPRRGRGAKNAVPSQEDNVEATINAAITTEIHAPIVLDLSGVEPEAAPAAKPARGRRKKVEVEAIVEAPAAEAPAPKATAKPAEPVLAAEPAFVEEAVEAQAPAAINKLHEIIPEAEEAPRPKRAGWWKK